MSQTHALNAILVGVQQAVNEIAKGTEAISIVTLDAVRTPDDAGYRVTLVVDVPDAVAEPSPH